MDSLIGLRGKDWAILAADSAYFYSIMKLSSHEDKIVTLPQNKLLALGGDKIDCEMLQTFIARNLDLYKFRNGYSLNTEETANYIRHVVSQALRRRPYNVNMLFAGVDDDGAKLFWIDYTGSLIQYDKSGQGYCQMFVVSPMDCFQRPNMTLQQGLSIVRKSIFEAQERLIMSSGKFTIKTVTKEGVRILEEIVKPQGFI